AGHELIGQFASGAAVGVDDGDVRTGFGEGSDGGFAHAGAAAGDECRLTGEVVSELSQDGSPSSFFAVQVGTLSHASGSTTPVCSARAASNPSSNRSSRTARCGCSVRMWCQ